MTMRVELAFRIQFICSKVKIFGRDVAYHAIGILDRLYLQSSPGYERLVEEYRESDLLVLAIIVVSYKYVSDVGIPREFLNRVLLGSISHRHTSAELYRTEGFVMDSIGWHIHTKTDFNQLMEWSKNRSLTASKREANMIRLLDVAILDARRYHYSREELFYSIFRVTTMDTKSRTSVDSACVAWLIPIQEFIDSMGIPASLPPMLLMDKYSIPHDLMMNVPTRNIFHFHRRRITKYANL